MFYSCAVHDDKLYMYLPTTTLPQAKYLDVTLDQNLTLAASSQIPSKKHVALGRPYILC